LATCHLQPSKRSLPSHRPHYPMQGVECGHCGPNAPCEVAHKLMPVDARHDRGFPRIPAFHQPAFHPIPQMGNATKSAKCLRGSRRSKQRRRGTTHEPLVRKSCTVDALYRPWSWYGLRRYKCVVSNILGSTRRGKNRCSVQQAATLVQQDLE